MEIKVPGYKTIEIDYILLDYNGTIATDGEIIQGVAKRLEILSKEVKIIVLTADTHGTCKEKVKGLPVTLKTFPKDDASLAKLEIIKELGKDRCLAFGNGRNDFEMLKLAGLSVAVVGDEGAYSKLLTISDIAVKNIGDGLDLILNPKRIIATLRG